MTRLRLTLASAMLAFCIPCFAQDIHGKIVGITDGDTATLLTSDNVQYKIRLASIDAPEKKQDYGMASKAALSDCAYGKLAVIDGSKKDRYGRLVGKVIVGGTDCNLRQIQLGLAWHYKKYQNEQELEDRSRYSHEEYLAHSTLRGLWVSKEPIPPWDYRKLNRNLK